MGYVVIASPALAPASTTRFLSVSRAAELPFVRVSKQAFRARWFLSNRSPGRVASRTVSVRSVPYRRL